MKLNSVLLAVGLSAVPVLCQLHPIAGNPDENGLASYPTLLLRVEDDGTMSPAAELAAGKRSDPYHGTAWIGWSSDLRRAVGGAGPDVHEHADGADLDPRGRRRASGDGVRLHRTRKHEGAEALLEDYRGYLQADTYSGCDRFWTEPDRGIVEVTCWAHATRKMYEARTSDLARAAVAPTYTGMLYKVERMAREWRAEERYALRQRMAAPVLGVFRVWMERQSVNVLPRSPLGGAIGFTLSNRAAQPDVLWQRPGRKDGCGTHQFHGELPAGED